MSGSSRNELVLVQMSLRYIPLVSLSAEYFVTRINSLWSESGQDEVVSFAMHFIDIYSYFM